MIQFLRSKTQLEDDKEFNNKEHNLLMEQYKSFKESEVQGLLEKYHTKNNSIKVIHKELRHISQKFLIKQNIMHVIFDELENNCEQLYKNQVQKQNQDEDEEQNNNQDEKETKLSFCVILKNQIKNGYRISVDKLIDIFGKHQDKDIKSQIVLAICELIEKQKVLINQDQQNIILQSNNIDSIVLSQFNQFLRVQQFSKCNSKNLSEYVLKKYIQKKQYFPSVHVTKQQIQQLTYQNCNINHSYNQFSQAINMKIFYQNHSTSLILGIQLQPSQERDGSDIYKILGHYSQVKKLYEKATKGQIITIKDKDYLGQQLGNFDPDKWKKIYSKLLTFEIYLCNRMIIKLFQRITGNQQYQQITELIVKKLFTFCQSNQKVKIIIFQNKNNQDIVNEISKYQPSNSNLNDIEQLLISIKNIKTQNQVDKEVLIQNLEYDINQMRIQALQTLFNIVKQKESKVKIVVYKYFEIKINKLGDEDSILKDTNEQFRLLALEINIYLFGTQEYKKVFYDCLDNINYQFEKGIEFMKEQAKDDKKLVDLFNCQTIQTIIQTYKQKIEKQNNYSKALLDLIVFYLQKEQSIHLDLQVQMFFQARIFQTEKDEQLNLLLSLLFSIQKNTDDAYYYPLLEEFKQFDAQCQMIIIFGLGSVIDKIKSQIIIPEELSDYLKNDTEKIKEGANYQIIKNISQNELTLQVSSQTAKIIYYLLTEKSKITKEVIIDNLLIAIESKEYLTQLYAAKALSEVQNYEDKIVEILIYKLDVNYLTEFSLYCNLSYINALKIKSKKVVVSKTHIQSLSRLFPFQEIIIENENLSIKIQDIILTIFFNQSNYQKLEFDVKGFEIFNQLFNANQNVKQALNIIYNYIKKKKIIPQETILAIENQFEMADNSKKKEINNSNQENEFNNKEICFEILKIVIQNGQKVSDKILEYLLQNLHQSKAQYEMAYKILEQIELNQELPEKVFTYLQMERVGYVLYLRKQEESDALDYLYQKTRLGFELSKHNLLQIRNRLEKGDREKLLAILLNDAKNKKSISQHILQELNSILNCDQIDDRIIQIFITILENNQELTYEIIDKLKKSLKINQVSDKVLLIFALLSQKEDDFDIVIIQKLSERMSNCNDKNLEYQILVGMDKQIEINQKFRQDKQILDMAQKCVLNRLEDENPKIVIICYNILLKLAKIGLIQNQIISKFLLQLQNLPLLQNQRQNILTILNQCQLEYAEKELVNLLQISEIDDLLKYQHQNPIMLYQQHFLLLSQKLNILKKSQKIEVLNLLLKCENKKEFPKDLRESLITLFSSEKDEQIQSCCIRLLHQLQILKIEIDDQLIQQIYYRDENKILQKLNIEFDQSLIILSPQKLKKDLEIMINNVDIPRLNQLIVLLHKAIKDGFILIQQSIEQLIIILNRDKQKICQETLYRCSKLFCYVVLQQNFINKDLVNFIEELIQNQEFQVYKKLIQTYIKIIKFGQFNQLKLTIETQLLKKQKNTEIRDHMIICTSMAYQFSNIETYIGLQILEVNLYNYDEILRYYSVKGLLAAKKNGQKSFIFDYWCETTKVMFSKESNIDIIIEDDLLEIISLLKYIDFDQIAKTELQQLKRELLLTNLLYKIKANNRQILGMLENWIRAEKKNCDKNQMLSILKNLSLDKKLEYLQLQEIINILVLLDIDKCSQIIENSLNYYQELKCLWIQIQLENKLETHLIKDQYLIEKAKIMCIKQLNFQLLNNVFLSLSKIDDLMKFEKLLVILNQNQFDFFNPLPVQTSLENIINILEIRSIINLFNFLQNNLVLQNVIQGLVNLGWNFNGFQQITVIVQSEKFDKVNKKEVEKNLLKVFEIYVNYSVNESDQSINLFSQQVENWLLEANLIATNKTLLQSRQKDCWELLDELQNLNFQNTSIQSDARVKFQEIIHQIRNTSKKTQLRKRYFKIFSKQNNKQISNWKLEDIQEWSQVVKKDRQNLSNNEQFFLQEVLAVISKAIQLHTDILLTDTQLLSVLVVILYRNTQKGRLLQVATGEGKSTIIVIIALIFALKGFKVDIVTSSPILAQRDSQYYLELFKYFNLECADNSDKGIYFQGPKKCYEKDVVYGEVSQFQFDILRQQYSKLGTLGGRQQEIVIVDEVDTMLIDDSSKLARLSTTITGLDHLHPLYLIIWQKVQELIKRIIQKEEKVYYIKQKTKNQQQIDDEEITKDLIQFCIEKVSNYVKKRIQKFDDSDKKDFVQKENQIKIPKNFFEFVELQLPNWITNAFLASVKYQEDVHYVISEDQIKPVDFDNTGLVQYQTHWGDGLHQFLQIKHNLKITSESFTTNFLSNVGFFKLYKNNILGLTGTLGSKKAQEILSQVYNVDLVFIPLSKEKLFIEFSTRFVDDNKWIDEICESAIDEARHKKRGVLIICQTIADAQQIYCQLLDVYEKYQLKLYIVNNMNQERQIEQILPSQIIVATNLAGRGTDIKTDEKIEKNGGLHVILTYLTSNKRVDDQIFGRTARQGKRGTGQMILSKDQLIKFGFQNFNTIRDRRDQLESIHLEDYKNNQLVLINLKDQLFQKFCKLLDLIRYIIRKQIQQQHKDFLTQELRKIQDQNNTVNYQIKQSKQNSLKNTQEELGIIKSIEENWALFLYKIDNNKIKTDEVLQEYDKFEQDVYKSIESNEIIKNPYYKIQIGKSYLDSIPRIFDNRYEKALKEFKSAQNLDESLCAAAQYYQSVVHLKKESSNDIQFKEKILQLLKNTLQIVIDEQKVIEEIVIKFQLDNKTSLSKQILFKFAILECYIDSIKQAIQTVRKSQRLITMYGNIQNDCYKDQVLIEEDQPQKKLKEKIKQNQIQAFTNYDIVFNNLTVRQDCGNRDQAEETINECIKYDQQSNICIQLNQIELQQIIAIFNKDENYYALDSESVLTKLNLYYKQKGVNVNLQVQDGNELKKYEKIEIDEAKAIIQNLTDKNQKFDLQILNVNEKTSNIIDSDVFPINSQAGLDLEFLDINYQFAQIIGEKIKSQSLDIEMRATKELILPIIQLIDPQGLKIWMKENQLYQNYQYQYALEYINNLSDESDLIVKLSIQENQKLIEALKLCEQICINITFNQIEYKEIKVNFSEGLKVKARFKNLKKKEAISLIQIIRKKNIEFQLIFKDVDMKDLKQVIEKASVNQERIEITKEEDTLEDLVIEEKSRVQIELEELANRGISQIYEINEKKFIPYRSFVVLNLIGAVQVLGGIALIGTGFGANVGKALIQEGIYDCINSGLDNKNRDFSWSNYALQKIISVTISGVTLGFSNFKDAGKGIMNICKKEAIFRKEIQLTTRPYFRNCLKIAWTQLNKQTKKLYQLAFKQTLTTFTEMMVQKGFNLGLNYATNYFIDLMKPKIQNMIQQIIYDTFKEHDAWNFLKKMLVIEQLELNSNQIKFHKQVERILISCLENSSFLRQISDFLLNYLQKLTFSNQVGIPIQIELVSFVLIGLLQIYFLIKLVPKTIIENLLEQASVFYGYKRLLHPLIQDLIQNQSEDERVNQAQREKYKTVMEIFTQVESQQGQEQNKFNQYPYSEVTKEQESKLQKVQITPEKRYKIKEFVNKIKDCENKIDINQDIMNITNIISKPLTDEILKITDSYLINHCINFAICKGTGYLFTKFQRTINHGLTFAEDIKDSAMKYTIAYQQIQIVQNINTNKNDKEINNNQLIVDAEDIMANKPADLKDKVIIDKILNINQEEIQVQESDLQNEDFINEIKNYYPNQDIRIHVNQVDDFGNSIIGHDILLQNDGTFFDPLNNFGQNNCTYAVALKQLNIQVNQENIQMLRNQVASETLKLENGQIILEASNWIKDRYPQDANKLLFVGGKKKSKHDQKKRRSKITNTIKQQKQVIKENDQNDNENDDIQKINDIIKKFDQWRDLIGGVFSNYRSESNEKIVKVISSVAKVTIPTYFIYQQSSTIQRFLNNLLRYFQQRSNQQLDDDNQNYWQDEQQQAEPQIRNEQE